MNIVDQITSYPKVWTFVNFEYSKHNIINFNIDLDSTFASPLRLSNTDDLSSNLSNMSFELESFNNNSNSFEFEPTSLILDNLDNSLQGYQKFSTENLNNPAYTDNRQSSNDDDEIV